MKTLIIDAKAIKEKDIVRLSEEVNYIKSTIGREPHLVIVNASDDLGSKCYIKNKIKTGKEMGIKVTLKEFDENVTQVELEQFIFHLNQDEDVDAIILQLPIYKHLNPKSLIELISPAKDADCFSKERLGEMIQGNRNILPCTPKGVIRLLEEHMVEIEGKDVTIIGRGLHVGQSLSLLLTQMGATVTVCHSKTKNLKANTINADIVISCVGRQIITPDILKEDSVLIGVGIVVKESKQHTDYDIDEIRNSGKCRLVSNRINSTGTMTVLSLCDNTINLCKEKYNL